MVMKSIDASWSTLVQVKKTQITGLMPTLVIFLMYPPECNFIVLWMIKLLLCMTSFKVILSKITSTYPRGHWVNYCHFVFSQMTSSLFWVPSPIIWLHGRCSSREVCSFALDDSGGGMPSIPKQPYLQWPTGYRSVIWKKHWKHWLLSLWIVFCKNINSDITSMG